VVRELLAVVVMIDAVGDEEIFDRTGQFAASRQVEIDVGERAR
jgi:hypothetical protein